MNEFIIKNGEEITSLFFMISHKYKVFKKGQGNKYVLMNY
jgi:hypothetical protein